MELTETEGLQDGGKDSLNVTNDVQPVKGWLAHDRFQLKHIQDIIVLTFDVPPRYWHHTVPRHNPCVRIPTKQSVRLSRTVCQRDTYLENILNDVLS